MFFLATKRLPLRIGIISAAPLKSTDRLVSAIACLIWGDHSGSCSVAIKTSVSPRNWRKCLVKKRQKIRKVNHPQCSRYFITMHLFNHVQSLHSSMWTRDSMNPTFWINMAYSDMHVLNYFAQRKHLPGYNFWFTPDSQAASKGKGKCVKLEPWDFLSSVSLQASTKRLCG